jgi:hypothetical protein
MIIEIKGHKYYIFEYPTCIVLTAINFFDRIQYDISEPLYDYYYEILHPKNELTLF